MVKEGYQALFAILLSRKKKEWHNLTYALDTQRILMKKLIQTKRANWKANDVFMDSKDINVTTSVLLQNNIYMDPTDSDFLGAVFKEYVRKKMEKGDRISLSLSSRDLYFYDENANTYLLNYIYNKLFTEAKTNPFDSILDCDEGSLNLSLFNGTENQLIYLLEILDELKIDFKVISKKYQLLSFPSSMRHYDKNEMSELYYEELKVK